MVEIRIHPKKTLRLLGMIIGMLVILHLVGCLPFFFFGRSHPLAPLSMDGEQNLPTAFSTAMLWCNALLVGGIAWAMRGAGWYRTLPWIGLFLAFLFMGADEAMELHERLIEPMRKLLKLGGLLHFSWVIPYALFSLIFALVYTRFLFELPRDTRKYIIIAAVVFVGGSIGMELFGGAWIEEHGRSPVYYLLAMVEEILEMAGCAIFIYAFMNHIDKHLPGLSLRITAE